jgi:hypothetical protein
MKRFVLGVMVVLSGAAALPLSASASTSGSTPPAALRSYVCQTAKMPAQRAMSITAVMGHVDGTAKLQMRFQLVKRSKRHGAWTTVNGPGLKSWISPKDPTLGTRTGDTWIVKHPVVGLAAPAYYRIGVAFRWLDSQGQVITSANRHSRVCFQPQPNLKVDNASVTGGTYRATVDNAGQTTSSPYVVQVIPAGSDTPLVASRPLKGLAPGGEKTTKLTGTACTPGEWLNFMVVPEDPTVASDTSEVQCPGPTTASARAHRGR